MIKLPNFDDPFEYENSFYLTCENARFAKIISHYELFKRIKHLSGEIVECGVFKGNSLIRFASFRDLCLNPHSHKVIGFDTFGKFPETGIEGDKKLRSEYLAEAGEQSISKEQLFRVFANKGIKNYELIEGDVRKTIPEYLKEHPELKIALLNLDIDMYEPAVVILKYLWERIVNGGILILDDYGIWEGETRAVDEFFKDKDVKILKTPYARTPCYIIKGEGGKINEK